MIVGKKEAAIKKFLTSAIFLVYLLIATFVLLEISVRMWGYSKHYLYDPIYTSFKEYPDIPYVHKPNLVNAIGRGQAIFNTDSLGLRSMVSGLRHETKVENEYRIAIVGDSITFGEGIKQTKDTYCEVLKEILNYRQNGVKVRMFNYGVSGYNVKNMVDTLQHRMLNIDPNLVVMAIIPGDFDLKRTGCVDKWGYTANKRTLGFMPKDSIVKFLFRRSHIVYLLRDICYKFVGEKRTKKEMPDSILPESFKYVEEFKEIAEKNKISYLILLLPSKNSFFKKAIHQFNESNINYLDLSSIYYDYPQDIYKTSRYDGHMSMVIHKRIAEKIDRYLLNLPPGKI